MNRINRALLISVGIVLIVVSAAGGAIMDRLYSIPQLDRYFPKPISQSVTSNNILTEESVVIDVAAKASPSVVTIAIKNPPVSNNSPFGGNNQFFDPFGFFGQQPQQNNPSPNNNNNNEQDIGSGFIIKSDGLIVTNKHVVSDTTVSYKVYTKDNKSYDVQKIFRDPANDIAILKIDSTGASLQPINMGDSSNLKVGQFVIAIGTALGEFRDTVTTGVVSGLGRGITAGSTFEGSVEQLDNVIQTDAAINPGNSGGPLLNSSGQVIGINTAISTQGQNIGFAIPINVIKAAIDNFNQTGQFSRPYLGVRYRMIDQRTAVMNSIPQGAYVQDVISGSPAEKAGIKADDIITKIDNIKTVGSDTIVSGTISGHKVGDKIIVEVYRNNKTQSFNVTLEEAK